MVIASLLSYWLLMSGKNLALYGIDTFTLLKTNKIYLDEKYSVDSKDYDEAEAIEAERVFNELLDEFKSENNPIIAKQLEIKIKKIASEMEFSSKVISVEQLIEDINRTKKLNNRIRY